MATTTKNASMPTAIADFAEAQIKSGRYRGFSEYVSDLIRHDMERAGQLEWLRRAIEEGEQSGISEQSLDDIFAAARTAAKAGSQPVNG